jgi:hypothetical protein
MPIPEAQLETWSHQGAMAGSRDTYATVKAVLADKGAARCARRSCRQLVKARKS